MMEGRREREGRRVREGGGRGREREDMYMYHMTCMHESTALFINLPNHFTKFEDHTQYSTCGLIVQPIGTRFIAL